MDRSRHNAIVSFIRGVADDVPRDLYVRGKYRDVILPMTVIPWLDSPLEPTKVVVLRAIGQARGIDQRDTEQIPHPALGHHPPPMTTQGRRCKSSTSG